ncbi:SpoIIE family protein phosphatase [Streptacidiphilus sp. PB12-B1b]|uniref:SpoIIE family protein phosphatase n=1 Tax=Streptacidiphilus sp. PB12-B1b TaxID=2705012 RepID=UPI001CDC21B3|nr:SpoIIE family protein phosphatase [Streptacidiphilus sp. PB12-B1b]
MGSQADGGPAPLRPEEVLGAAGIGVWRWNRPGDLLELDPVCGRLLGLEPPSAQLPGRRLRSLLHVEDFIRLSETVQLAVAEQRTFEARVRVLTDRGALRRVLRLLLVPGPPTGPYPVQGTAVEGRWSDDLGPGPALTGRPAPGGGRNGTRPLGPMIRDGGGDLADELRQIDGLNRAPGSLSAPAAVPAPQQPAAPGPVVRPERADAPVGDLRRSREAFLLDAGRALAEASTTSEVLRVVASLSMPGFSPDGLAVFGVEGAMLTVVGQHGHREGDEAPFRMSLDTDYPAAEVVRTGRPVYLATPEEYRARYPTTWPLAAGFGRNSWAFLPLVTAGRTIGTWLAAFREPVRFTPDERSVLSTVARMLAHALERAHTNESERALSLGLRRSMGQSTPAIEGMTVASRYVPTGGGLMVGGDWYDVIDLPEGRLALVIGDVQGHDVHAANLMAQLRTAVHAYAAEGHHPDAVLARTSRFLAALDDDRFATCVYIEADPVRGTLAIARAGHPHPVLRMPDGTCLIRHVAGGLPLGLMPEEEDYPVTTMELQVGEVMLLCTDGLIETGGHDMYSGWVRVRDTMSPGPADDLEGMADALIRAVHGPASHLGPGHLADRREDDIALLLLRRDPVGLGPEPPARQLVLTVGQDQPERIAAVRAELRAVLHDWAVEDHVDAALLLASELLANVLVHTDREATLVAGVYGQPGGRRLRLEVADQSDELPHRRTPGEMASSGRGLILLELLADRWGMQPRGQGKSIWFELDEAGGASGGGPGAEG